MKKVLEFLKNIKNQGRPTVVEYCTMAALIAVLILLTLTNFGQQLNAAFIRVAAAVAAIK